MKYGHPELDYLNPIIRTIIYSELTISLPTLA
jgi:hypothetical protein